ncbi:MAG: nicotinamide-nucleotide amidohydrolase family protein [Azoarcus sp.]|jgi:nicotinamide-nucleotide amidase|nr:nicotinamide-nucleotide amidohydrolase family protein [Azoarcus sp.]
MDLELATLSAHLGKALAARGWMLATAESCTGGWIAEAVTATAGSSAWFDRGFVTYSNEAKVELLDVSPATLSRYGAVSENTVHEMTAGALTHSHADVAVAISGIAGPGGGSADKPVGTVCLAWRQRHGDAIAETRFFPGERESIRRQIVVAALEGIIALAA